MLLDHCSATQYRYAMPKVGHLSPCLNQGSKWPGWSVWTGGRWRGTLDRG